MKKQNPRQSHLEQAEQNLLQHVMDRRRRELNVRGGGPSQLSGALREVIARRKIGRMMESRELSQLWTNAVTPDVAAKTRLVSLRNRILLVEVADSVLMSELASFYQRKLVRDMQQARPDLGIKNLKFRLNPSLNKRKPA